MNANVCDKSHLGHAAALSQLDIEVVTREIQGASHSQELQSMRGIAAVLVLLHHCSFYYAYSQKYRFIASVLFNAHAAVVFFFVLSGYVLTASLMRSSTLSTKVVAEFWTKRLFRIYPALWLTVIISILSVVAFYKLPVPENVSPWWKASQRQVPSLSSSIKTLLSWSTSLPIPIWTLRIEFAGACTIPVLAWVLQKSGAVFAIAVCVLGVVSLFSGTHLGLIPQHLVDFALGAAILPLKKRVASLTKSNGPAIVVAAASGLFAYFGRYTIGADFFTAYFSAWASLIEAIGSAILIAVVVSRSELFGWLRLKFLVIIGDISYSLYLLHLTVLACVAIFLDEIFHLSLFTANPLSATCALMAFTLTISVILSAATYRFVEVPGINAGKALIKRIKERGHQGADRL